MCFVMPSDLHRTYGAHHLHFITCSCYQRLPFLPIARSRDCFVLILERTRERYRFVVVGYVVMPEHSGMTSPRCANSPDSRPSQKAVLRPDKNALRTGHPRFCDASNIPKPGPRGV
jgi:hypothetical protein